MNLTLLFKGMTQDDVSQAFHPGHQAWDLVENSTPKGKLYGTPLCAPENCLVLGVTDEGPLQSSKELERGYGVRLEGLETGLEYLFWHILPLSPVKAQDRVSRGQIVAYMGNAGNVYVGGVYVPLDQRTTDPEPGTHLHLEVYKDGVRIDPEPLFNWNLQPQYSLLDFIKSVSIVLSKALTKL